MTVSLLNSMEHLGLVLASLAGGGALGFGLGWACGALVLSARGDAPSRPRASLLIPWRTVCAFLIVYLWSWDWMLRLQRAHVRLGFGFDTTLIVTAISMAVLAGVAVALARTERTSPLRGIARTLNSVRTLAVGGAVVVVIAGSQFGAGAGRFLAMARNYYRLDLIWPWIGVAVMPAFLLDMIIGGVQLALSVGSRHKLSEQAWPAGPAESESEGEMNESRFCPYCGSETVRTAESERPYCKNCQRYIAPSGSRADSASGYTAGRTTASVGLKAICVLWFLGSALSIYLGFSLAVYAASYEAGWVAFLGILQGLLGVAQLVSVFGLWGLRPWAWTLAVSLLWIGLLFRVIGLLSGNWIEGGIGAIVSVLFLVYFYSRRDWFGK